MLSGFRRVMGKNICDALDAKYYEDLDHHVYGYDDVWPEDFFDEPSWRAKEELKNLAARQAIRFKVSYEWSGGKVLLVLIIGAARLASDYPALEAYVQPD